MSRRAVVVTKSWTVLADNLAAHKPATSSAAAFSTSPVSQKTKRYELVVVGGGSGGCATAHMFSRKMGRGKVAVIEPADVHYYQPLWTLVGGGIKKVEQSGKPMGKVLPRNCDWIQEKCVEFDPDNCTVTTESGDLIRYQYLVVAMGLQLNYHLIKGLPEAFDIDPMLCSNYWNKQVVKTRPAMEAFKEGNAIFTFPNTPIKCAGAPQKIMYLTEHYLRKSGKRQRANVLYNTSLGVIFGVRRYAETLSSICQQREIKLNFRHNLIEVRPEKKEAVFQHLDTHETKVFPYEMMHIVPPMSTPKELWDTPLVDETGYVTVNRETLQHIRYPNVFGIGDNTNVPTSKTAAAIASQTGVLLRNLCAVLSGKEPGIKKYDGYTSCPVVTAPGKCVMAEFDWDGQPLETFPFDQSKERRTMYHFKRDIFPEIYWNMLIKGMWYGPALIRKGLHLGMSR